MGPLCKTRMIQRRHRLDESQNRDCAPIALFLNSQGLLFGGMAYNAALLASGHVLLSWKLARTLGFAISGASNCIFMLFPMLGVHSTESDIGMLLAMHCNVTPPPCLCEASCGAVFPQLQCLALLHVTNKVNRHSKGKSALDVWDGMGGEWSQQGRLEQVPLSHEVSSAFPCLDHLTPTQRRLE